MGKIRAIGEDPRHTERGQVEHARGFVDRVDRRGETGGPRARNRTRRRSPIRKTNRPGAGGTPDRDTEADVLDGSHSRAESAHHTERSWLERDDHRIVVDELERPPDDVVAPVAVRMFEFDHHADPSGCQLQHFLERWVDA